MGGPECEVQVGRRGDEGQGSGGSGVSPGTLGWISAQWSPTACLLCTLTYPYTNTQHFFF